MNRIVLCCALAQVSACCALSRAASFTRLGDLPGGSVADARAVSADGKVVVGGGDSPSGNQSLRWTQATGSVGLGDLPGGTFSGGAFGVSADGSVIVGNSNSANGTEAFRWTQGTGGLWGWAP